MRTIWVVLPLFFCGSAEAQSRWSRESIVPTFALSAGSDGALSGKVSVLFALDGVIGLGVHTFSLAPTFAVTDRTNSPFFSVGAKTGTPDFGANKVSGGIMVAYTFVRAFDQTTLDEADAALQEGLDTCKKYVACPEPAGSENATFCDTYAKKRAGTLPGNPDLGTSYDPKDLCPAGAKVANFKTLTAIVQAQYRYPIIDLSLWGGAGGSLFNYYLAQASMPQVFDSKSDWKPNGAFAFQLTAVPQLSWRSVGLTIEVPLYYQNAFQASKTLATACKMAGTLASDPTSVLSSCSSPQSIGVPKAGSNVSVEAYLGVVDKWNGIWRVAVGGGYSHDEVTGSDTWSVKIPFYLDATALGAKDKTSTPQDHAPVKVDYAGIIRLTPTFQSTPNQSSTWSVLLNVELLGQRNMFLRADTLVR